VAGLQSVLSFMWLLMTRPLRTRRQ
jgi:hypothetical protein